MGLPPKWVRRLLVAPLVLALCLALIALSPVFLLVAFVADLFVPGSWRTVRMVAFAVFYLVMEVVGLVAMFVLWIRFGFGTRLKTERAVEAHYLFETWWLYRMYRAVGKLFGLKINIEERPEPQPGPLLVFCRHAGPGNSLMLIGTMMIAYKRRPRIVMLAKLQWDPLFDTMGNRLPNRFITHDKKDASRYTKAIGELAEGLRDHDAFVLFPEGRDFTQRLRVRAIDYLRERGFDKSAEKAEQMFYVLPPRHRGPLAAITAAPEADVAFVAHSVLEELGSFKELWRRIPLQHTVDAQYWRLTPDQVPRTEEEVIEWLYQWWERIDDWIARHKVLEPV
ncbi:MAG TPA: 1-acyl-sn-glycerol-3-phosphate acyltransferase [Actinomycetota bacterium]|nr:1-acyl-sn-glycerol-3-phosphate acyltransferase [Actinomycetota bacterium]